MKQQELPRHASADERLFPSVAAMFLSLIGVYVVPFQIGAWIDGLGISPSVAGFLGSVEIGSVAIVNLLLARWVARLSPAYLAWGGVALVALGQAASAMSVNVTLITAFRLCVGIGCGCLLASATTVTAASNDPDRAFGRIYALTSIGYAAYTTIMPFFTTHQPNVEVFAMSTGLAVLLIPALLFLPRRPLVQTTNAQLDEPHPINWIRAGLLFAIITLVFTVLGGVYFFAERVGSGIGVTTEVIGASYGASSVAGFLFAGFAGLVGSKHGRRLPLALSSVFSGIVCAAMLLVRTPVQFISALILLGGLYMYALTYAVAAAAELDPLGRLATAAQGYILISMSLGSYLYGLLTEIRGISFMSGPSLMACLVGAALTLVLFSRPTTQYPEKMER